MNTPTFILTEEHKNILKVIETIEEECYSIKSGRDFEVAFFEKAIDFIKNYADRFHHAKEEDILFKELGKDPSQMHCNPMNQMLHEHDIGRAYVKEMEQGLSENDKNKVTDNAQGYCQLLRQHIYKEDNILYKMADEALGREVQEKMLKKFEQAEAEFSKDEINRLLHIVDEFEERMNKLKPTKQ